MILCKFVTNCESGESDVYVVRRCWMPFRPIIGDTVCTQSKFGPEILYTLEITSVEYVLTDVINEVHCRLEDLRPDRLEDYLRDGFEIETVNDESTD